MFDTLVLPVKSQIKLKCYFSLKPSQQDILTFVYIFLLYYTSQMILRDKNIYFLYREFFFLSNMYSLPRSYN